MTISIGDTVFELNSQLDISLRNELIANATIILTTLRGTTPQNRAMGMVSSDIIGRNFLMVKGAYSVQAIEQISRYEPRLSVAEVNFEAEGQKIIPKVVLTYNGN